MNRIGAAAPLVAAAALATLVACTTEDTNSSEGTPPPGDLFVEVLLDEFTIAMPDSVPAGTVSFEISNVGEMEHSFAIEGPGLEDGDEIADSLAPTETFVYTAELQPGTYTVWCPIGDHRGEGMEATIEVTEGAAGTDDGAQLGDEAVTPSEEQAPLDGY